MDFNGASKIIAGMGGLIALYLVVANAQGFNQITTSSAAAAGSLVTTLQGR